LHTYYAIRLALKLSPHLSRPNGRRLCTVLGYLFYLVNASARESITDNMRHVLGDDCPPRRLRRVVRRIFVNIVLDYYDMVLLSALSWEDASTLIEPHGLEQFRAARRQGRGVIAVFFHTSGYNLAGQIAMMGDWKGYIVAEPLHPPRIAGMVNRLRTAQGVELIPADRSGMRRIVRALRANEIVGLAGDRDVNGTGIDVELFGSCATLPAGVAALALRTGAVISPVHQQRRKDGGVRVWIGDPVECEDTGDFDEDVKRITQEIAWRYECALARRPSEWVMVQPAWRGCGRTQSREPLPSRKREIQRR